MHSERALVAGLAVALFAAALSGCDTCEGRELSQTTYRATFVPADGAGPMSSSLTVVDEDAAMFGPGGAWWTAAVQNAAGARSGFGFVTLNGPGRALALGLPFPLAAGQVLPIQASALLATYDSFSFDSPRSLSLPADAVVGLLELPSVPDCTRAMPNACDADSQAQLAQTLEGTVEIVTASPLRLRVQATASYPPDSARTPVSVAGDVTFVLSDAGEICRGG